MRFAIDCEFNGKGGELISMALVGEDGREFYEVVGVPADVQPWVAEHVVPILGKEAIGKEAFQRALIDFIKRAPAPVTIVADWPVDIAYFCDWVIVGEYPHCTAPVFKADILSLPSCPASEVPHNALSDARAIAGGVFGSDDE